MVVTATNLCEFPRDNNLALSICTYFSSFATRPRLTISLLPSCIFASGLIRFSQALAMAQSFGQKNSGNPQDVQVDEQGLQDAHARAYGQGNSGSMDAR